MTKRKGDISVSTKDIFPIIKKWLYSEHDIFLRELISNSTDAISKRATLSRVKNVETPSGEIRIEIDKKNKTLSVIDNGIGMSEEEIEKYIAQLAFSGAQEFVNKMKESKDLKEDIIGKFGLGFYSVFMVAEKVSIDSLSYQEGAKPIKWTCTGETEYEFEDSNYDRVGTKVSLFLNEESLEFLESYKTRAIIKKYCEFMPYPIQLIDLEEIQKIEEENSKQEKEEDKKPIPVDIINSRTPLWKKEPNSLKDEDYKNFYQELFPFESEPLFWLHLNVEHPFHLQGILYFPKLSKVKPANENNIKLYSKQVFVSDNVKNIIPEFLSLLKGGIDSVDIPLNVSRSSLQGDPNIVKISNYIVKKVSESLKKLFKTDRKRYEDVWADISLFVKYGIISHEKFAEQMRGLSLFLSSEDKLITLEEYEKLLPEKYKEKLQDKVIYVEKDTYDTSLARKLHDEKIPYIIADSYIDPHFMQHLEFQGGSETKKNFVSLDGQFEDLFGEEKAEKNEELEGVFKEIFKDGEISFKNMGENSTPMYVKVDEQSKRFQRMSESMGQDPSQFPIKKTLIINPGNELIQKIESLWKEDKDLASKIGDHLQGLALMSQEGWGQEERTAFIKRSQELIGHFLSSENKG